MSSIAPHSLDTHVIQNSSFCITSDLLVQQKTRARIVFLFSDCHKFSILFLKQRRLSTRTITRGLVIVTAISETWFTTYQVFSEEEQQKKIHIWNMTSQNLLFKWLIFCISIGHAISAITPTHQIKKNCHFLYIHW